MMRLSYPMVAAAGAAVAVVPTWVWAQAPSDAERYAFGPHMMWGYGMIFGPLFMILLLAVGDRRRGPSRALACHAVARRIASGAAGSHTARHPERALRPRRD